MPTLPNLGVLNLIMKLILINQALGHPKTHFQGPDRQNFRLSTPPPKRCQKWVLSSREPGRALLVPIPPNLGVLSPIISLVLINQALGHPKMRFSGSRPTEFPFLHAPPPPNGADNWFFHLVSPGGHFRYPPPLIWGC